MINGHGRSDSAIVAERPTNKAGQLAAEPGERRAETKGNAAQQSTRRAQNRESVFRSGWADMARPPRKAATSNVYPPVR